MVFQDRSVHFCWNYKLELWNNDREFLFIEQVFDQISAIHFAPHSLGYIGLAAVLGHVYPVFFQFKGGKGVATTLGVLLGLNGLLGIAVIGTWLLVAILSRYSSLAALVAIVLAPLYALAYNLGDIVLPLALIAILIVYQHQENIQRLLSKKESKIKF